MMITTVFSWNWPSTFSRTLKGLRLDPPLKITDVFQTFMTEEAWDFWVSGKDFIIHIRVSSVSFMSTLAALGFQIQGLHEWLGWKQHTQSTCAIAEEVPLGNPRVSKNLLENLPDLGLWGIYYLYYHGQGSNLAFALEGKSIFIFQGCWLY